jgi:hypothetical protein
MVEPPPPAGHLAFAVDFLKVVIGKQVSEKDENHGLCVL